MWWAKTPEPPVRDQLIEACAKVRLQLDRLRRPLGGRKWASADLVKAELEATLARLEQALADLDAAAHD